METDLYFILSELNDKFITINNRLDELEERLYNLSSFVIDNI